MRTVCSRGETALAVRRLGAVGRILECGPAIPASTCALTHDFRKQIWWQTYDPWT